MKDKLTLYDDYFNLEFRCYACSKSYHSPLQCPAMHYELNREKFITDQLNDLYRFQKSFVRRPRPKSRFESYHQLKIAAQNITVNLGQNIENYMYQTPIIEDLEDTLGESTFIDRAPRRSETTPYGFSESLVKFYRQSSLKTNVILTVEEGRPIKGKGQAKRTKQKDSSKKQNKAAQIEDGVDKVCSYKYYFPHNNIEVIAGKCNEKLKQSKKLSRSKIGRRPVSMIYDKQKLKNENDPEEKTCYLKSTHDYGVGSIDFDSEHSRTSISDEDLNEHTFSDDVGLHQSKRHIPTSDGDSKDNIDTSPVDYNQEIVKKKSPLSPPPIPNIMISQNFMHGSKVSVAGESYSEIKDAVDNEKDAAIFLKQIIAKYGTDYVKQALLDKTSREVQTL